VAANQAARIHPGSAAARERVSGCPPTRRARRRPGHRGQHVARASKAARADEFAFADPDERFELLIDIFVDGLARRATQP
jgi:hypothetical protein